MKCPSCNSKIQFMKIRNEFFCPSCNKRLRTTHGGLALLIAAASWLIFSLIVISIFKDNQTATLIDITLGSLISFLVFTNVMKLERIG